MASTEHLPPDELTRKLEQEAAEKLKRYQQLRTDLAAIEATHSSADGTVTVTVLPGGAVKDIQLSAKAMRKSSAELEELLTSTIRRATVQVSERMAERVQETVGDTLDVIGMVNARLPALPDDADEVGTQAGWGRRS